MTKHDIVFIGGGNMGASLVGGLIADGHDPRHILVSEPDETRRTGLQNRFAVKTINDNTEALKGAAVVVLAVKPQTLEQVAEEIAPVVKTEKPLIISIAAGIREQDLQRWLGGGAAIVRAMPNTPAMIQAGASVLHAAEGTSAQQRSQAESILRAVGLTLWVEDETLMDAVTALSGSGPAYFFLIMEILEQVGVELGLPQESARLLSLQTAMGAAKMALESADPAAVLRQRVTSPGGTTERALETLEEGDLRGLFQRALTAARDRSRELSQLLGRS